MGTVGRRGVGRSAGIAMQEVPGACAVEPFPRPSWPARKPRSRSAPYQGGTSTPCGGTQTRIPSAGHPPATTHGVPSAQSAARQRGAGIDATTRNGYSSVQPSTAAAAARARAHGMRAPRAGAARARSPSSVQRPMPPRLRASSLDARRRRCGADASSAPAASFEAQQGARAHRPCGPRPSAEPGSPISLGTRRLL